MITKLDDWIFDHDYCYDLLIKQYNTNSLKGFGLQDIPSVQIAAGVILHYLIETQKERLPKFKGLSFVNTNEFMLLDYLTRKNLEIEYRSDGSQEGSLFKVLDNTITPMGARLLKKWITHPLINKNLIEERLKIVEIFFEQQSISKEITELFKSISDLERIKFKN